MTHRPLALALAAAFGCHGLCLPASAETVLGTVSVEAEAAKEPADETATASTISREQLSRETALSIKDAVRYEAGVSVSNNPSRFGQAGFNIRGVDGDRVAMEIDGVRLPDEFKTGGYANAGRNLVDVRLLKAIEIQRGSGSVLFGSGALGGAVRYVTPDPEDYLGADRVIGGRIETQYASANDASALIPTLAIGGSAFKLLLSGVAQRATETESMGTNDSIGIYRTVANPQDEAVRAGLVKLAYEPRPRWRSTLTYDAYARDVDTRVFSQIKPRTTELYGDDRYRRERLSFEQRLPDLTIGTLDAHFYVQRSNTHQDTLDIRRSGTPATWEDALRTFDYDQDSVGLRLQGEKIFEANGGHRLLWGLDASRRKTVQIRDGFTRNYLTGTIDKVCLAEGPPSVPGGPPTWLCPPYPEVNQVNGLPYPDRDFPASTITEFSVHAQDNWVLSDAWSFTFGLRYDRNTLRVSPDAIYLDPEQDGVLKSTPSNKETDAFSPKFGATWRFSPGYALSMSYNFGFRVAPYDSVNSGFENRNGGYISLPNADLKPEYSQGPEVKLEFRGDRGYWNLSAYYTHYDDFIENQDLCSTPPAPTDPADCSNYPSVFQSINLPTAEIHGLEAAFGWYLDGARRWRARGTLTYARGRDHENNPLDSIDPLKGTLGLAYAQGPWEVAADLSFADKKRFEDVRQEGSRMRRSFLTQGYGVLDLRAHWQFAKSARMSMGVLNVFDRKYMHWADVPVYDPIHIAGSGSGPDRFTQPGRNYTFSLSYDFK